MKEILLVEDDFNTQRMYNKVFTEMFPEAVLTQCYTMEDVTIALASNKQYNLYILDGQIIGGHTASFIDTLPKEKIVVISASPDYHKDVTAKGIMFIYKPFLSSQIREKKELFEGILNKNA